MNLPLGYSIDTNYDSTYDLNGDQYSISDPDFNYPVHWDSRTWVSQNYYPPFGATLIDYPAEPVFTIPKPGKTKKAKPPKKIKKKKLYFATQMVCASGFNPPKNFLSCVEAGYPMPPTSGGGFGLGADDEEFDGGSYPRYPEGTLPQSYFTPVERPVDWPILVMVGIAGYFFLTMK